MERMIACGRQLVYLGSTCHNTDLVKPVKRLVEDVGKSPAFKLAGFVTHATQMPEDGERARELYERWAGNCIRSFRRVSEEKQIGVAVSLSQPL